MAGPLLATYYATKNYVVQLTKAVYEELRSTGSRVVISALCPGPVDTEFNSVAGVKSFGIPSENEAYVADYAIERLLCGDLLIIPGVTTKQLRQAQDLLRQIPSQNGKNVTGAEEQIKI